MNDNEDVKDQLKIKNKEIYLIDKNSSSRPSQNILKALNEMAKAVYPDVYNK